MKFAIQVPIYWTSIHVCDTPEEQPIPGTEGENGTLMSAVWHQNGGVYFTYDKQTITPAIFAHEALHIVHHIFEMKGIRADVLNDEHTAYLLQWVFENLYNPVIIKEDS